MRARHVRRLVARIRRPLGAAHHHENFRRAAGTLELDENLAPISATVTVTKKVLGCFDEPRVAFQLSYTQGTQGMPRVERLES